MEFEERAREADRRGAPGGGGKLVVGKLEVKEGVETYAPPELVVCIGAAPPMIVDRRAGGGGGGFRSAAFRCGSGGGARMVRTLSPATFPTSKPAGETVGATSGIGNEGCGANRPCISSSSSVATSIVLSRSCSTVIGLLARWWSPNGSSYNPMFCPPSADTIDAPSSDIESFCARLAMSVIVREGAARGAATSV